MGVFSWHSSFYDPKEVRHFYDPHPCFIGALFSVPMRIKEVLVRVKDQNISIGEVVDQIKAVTDCAECRVFVNSFKGFVGLEIKGDSSYDAGHTFCLIKFR